MAALIGVAAFAAAQGLPDRRAESRREAPDDLGLDLDAVEVELDELEDLLDDPLYNTGPLSPCDPERRACFEMRFEFLIQPERPRDGFFEPPPLRRVALEREIYRQLLMDQTPYRCERIGGLAVLAAARDRVAMSFVVPLHEAYDSGLTRRELPAFAADPVNLTLSLVSEERARNGRDAYGYLPQRNPCWYAWQHLMVKQRWSLRVDPLEAEALSAVLAACPLDRVSRPTCSDDDAEEDAQVLGAVGRR